VFRTIIYDRDDFSAAADFLEEKYYVYMIESVNSFPETRWLFQFMRVKLLIDNLSWMFRTFK